VILLRPKVCVSIAPKAESETEKLMLEADASPASIIEVRLDSLVFSPHSLRKMMRRLNTTKPFVLTVSDDPTIGFGQTKMGAEALRLLADLAEYVDAPGLIDEPGASKLFGDAKLIRSKHFHHGLSFDEGLRVLEELKNRKCDLVKMVFAAEKIQDNLVAMRLASKTNFPNIVFCMGEKGLLSRLMAPICGSQWTYASLKQGLETASGQIDVQTVVDIYDALMRGSRFEV
jgi:3-dehydroquinate dehydratase/shikimate dehydrogenase